MKNLNRRKNLYIVLASAMLFFVLIFFFVVRLNIKAVQYDLDSIDKALQISSENKRVIKSYIEYKHNLGALVQDIRVEPVFIEAKFSLNDVSYKINNIIDSTYKGRGFFFLDKFYLGKKNNEDSDNQDVSMKDEALNIIKLKGKKALLFKR